MRKAGVSSLKISKLWGYVPDTDSIHDVKAQLLNTHNEKLGMAA
jgi:hypothetical protein